jgi:hypothetical protein
VSSGSCPYATMVVVGDGRVYRSGGDDSERRANPQPIFTQRSGGSAVYGSAGQDRFIGSAQVESPSSRYQAPPTAPPPHPAAALRDDFAVNLVGNVLIEVLGAVALNQLHAAKGTPKALVVLAFVLCTTGALAWFSRKLPLHVLVINTGGAAGAAVAMAIIPDVNAWVLGLSNVGLPAVLAAVATLTVAAQPVADRAARVIHIRGRLAVVFHRLDEFSRRSAYSVVTSVIAAYLGLLAVRYLHIKGDHWTGGLLIVGGAGFVILTAVIGTHVGWRRLALNVIANFAANVLFSQVKEVNIWIRTAPAVAGVGLALLIVAGLFALGVSTVMSERKSDVATFVGCLGGIAANVLGIPLAIAFAVGGFNQTSGAIFSFSSAVRTAGVTLKWEAGLVAVAAVIAGAVWVWEEELSVKAVAVYFLIVGSIAGLITALVLWL